MSGTGSLGTRAPSLVLAALHCDLQAALVTCCNQVVLGLVGASWKRCVPTAPSELSHREGPRSCRNLPTVLRVASVQAMGIAAIADPGSAWRGCAPSVIDPLRVEAWPRAKGSAERKARLGGPQVVPAELSDCVSIGANARIRTADLLITNQLLYRLSYVGPGGAQSSTGARGAPRALC